ncbi:MAG: hypothetical protein JXD18_07020 [Anaerolineae bacterium]|nr:hypothetical protein [Anaerolineae bacterium]
MLDGLLRSARWLKRRAKLFTMLALLALVVTQEGPPPSDLTTGVGGLIYDARFDFVTWEIEAVWAKFTHWLLQPQRYLRESDRADVFRGYVELMARLQNLEWQIETVYADPAVSDPDAATAEARAELERLRAEAAVRQWLAESIIEEQVGTVLSEEGLAVLGQPFPPVGMHFTPLPYLLVVSPRERIERVYSSELEHGLALEQRVSIEHAVDESFDVSSLVTGIGGLSAWPAMILELPNIAWVAEVTAHEWTHHYLDLRPLGWSYYQSGDARTINETTASIVGTEVGRGVVARYYPDLLPPEVPEGEAQPADPPAFDFNAEMRLTRVEVDRLLAEGRVEEAEAYMEARRQVFWEHGYRGLRKLNQAYFAFHGAYADEPGAAGEDPVGPTVRAFRQGCPRLRAFLARIAFITTLEELEAALAAASD